MKILLVDDDAQLAQLISHRLRQSNYTVEVARTGNCAIALIEANPYDLILLDVILPNLSGIEVCQQLRLQGDRTPILMLTGQDQLSDKVIGLDAGADDYLAKPFELDELLARVRALLRRSSDTSTPLLQYGGMVFDPASRDFTYRGEALSLRPKEIAILELMLRYPTQIFSAHTLLDRLWNLADCPGIATIKSHIRSLRKQLDAVGAHNLIETLYGRGYRLNPEFLQDVALDSLSKQPQPLPQPSRSAPAHSSSSLPLHSALDPSLNASPPWLTSQELVAQAWETMQVISWQRLMHLKAAVQSLHHLAASSSMAASRHRSPGDQTSSHLQCVHQDFSDELQRARLWQEAKDLAHQLKGSLGMFGFEAASSKAGLIEKSLSRPLCESQLALGQIMHLVEPVEDLEALVRQRMTQPHLLNAAIPTQNSPLSPKIEAEVLLISRDHVWQQNLQRCCLNAPFSLRLSSTSNLDYSLLQHSLGAIVLELSSTHHEVDLSLLQALAKNYSGLVPIIVATEVTEAGSRTELVEKLATVCVPKSWSAQTLFSVIVEYLAPLLQDISAEIAL